MPKTYTHQHRSFRQTLEPQVAAGGVRCWRCGQPIQPGEPWDLGHDDANPTVWRGPEHRACNRATQTPGRATAVPVKRTRRTRSRSWRSRRW